MFYHYQKRIPNCRQWFAGLQVCIIMMVSGMNVGWKIPFMGLLVHENPPFIATKEQISWFSSLDSLTRPIGNLVGALSNHYFGCKISIHLFSAAYYLIACMLLAFSTTIEHIYVTQIFTGIGLGSLKTLVHLYIAEIAGDQIRGTLIYMALQGYLIGIIVGNALGAFIECWIYAVVNIVLITIYVITFFFFPQTPTKLLQQKKYNEAQASLKWYQDNIDAEKKIQEFSDFLRTKPKLKILDELRNLTKPVNRKVMIILFVLYGFLQFCGIYTFVQYSEIIFIEGGVNVLPPAVLVLIMSTMGVLGCWIAMYTSRKFGRTVLLSFSCTFIAISLLVLGMKFQLTDLGYSSPLLQWMIIISALVFRFSMTIGVTGVPQILVGELLAPNVKNVGSCICNLFSSLCSFLSNKNFQLMVDTMTYKNVFFLFAAMTFIMGICIAIYVPETKGMSLPEIQNMLEESIIKKKKDNAKSKTGFEI